MVVISDDDDDDDDVEVGNDDDAEAGCDDDDDDDDVGCWRPLPGSWGCTCCVYFSSSTSPPGSSGCTSADHIITPFIHPFFLLQSHLSIRVF